MLMPDGVACSGPFGLRSREAKEALLPR